MRSVIQMVIVLLFSLSLVPQMAWAVDTILFSDNFEGDLVGALPGMQGGDVGSYTITAASGDPSATQVWDDGAVGLTGGVQGSDGKYVSVRRSTAAAGSRLYANFDLQGGAIDTTGQAILISFDLYQPSTAKGLHILGTTNGGGTVTPRPFDVRLLPDGSVQYAVDPNQAHTIEDLHLTLDQWLKVEILVDLGAGEMSLTIGGTTINDLPLYHSVTTMNSVHFGSMAVAPAGVATPHAHSYLDNIVIRMVPEPASIVCMAIGGGALMTRRRRL